MHREYAEGKAKMAAIEGHYVLIQNLLVEALERVASENKAALSHVLADFKLPKDSGLVIHECATQTENQDPLDSPLPHSLPSVHPPLRLPPASTCDAGIQTTPVEWDPPSGAVPVPMPKSSRHRHASVPLPSPACRSTCRTSQQRSPLSRLSRSPGRSRLRARAPSRRPRRREGRCPAGILRGTVPLQPTPELRRRARRSVPLHSTALGGSARGLPPGTLLVCRF